jgi:hypothetical protein
MRARRDGGLRRVHCLLRVGSLRRVGSLLRARGLRWFLHLGLLFLAAPAFGQGSVTELLLFRTGESLRADVRAYDLLDERTTLTIESGLPGSCVYLLRLEDRSGRLVAERYVERSLHFDVWENRYVLESAEETLALPTLAAADSVISHLANCDLGPLSRLRPEEEYQLTLQIAVRPLGPEDRERFSRYVSRNSSGGGEEIAFDLSALLGHAEEEKGTSRQVIGRASPFFRAGDLREAP